MCQTRAMPCDKPLRGHGEKHLSWERASSWGKGSLMGDLGTSRCKLLHIERVNNKVLLYNTGNYIRYHVINCNGKEYKKECIYIYL